MPDLTPDQIGNAIMADVESGHTDEDTPDTDVLRNLRELTAYTRQLQREKQELQGRIDDLTALRTNLR